MTTKITTKYGMTAIQCRNFAVVDLGTKVRVRQPDGSGVTIPKKTWEKLIAAWPNRLDGAA